MWFKNDLLWLIWQIDVIDYISFIFTDTNQQNHDDVTFVAPKIKFVGQSVSAARQYFTMNLFRCTFYLYSHKTGASYNLDIALSHTACI